MDWVSVAALASPVVTGAGILFIDRRAKDVAKEVVGEAVRLALSEFKLQLLEEMNGKYLRTREQLIDNKRFDDSIGDLKGRVHEVEPRISKCERDIGHLTASYSRAFRPQTEL